MIRATRFLPLILLVLLAPVLLTACGSNNNDSSSVLWGHSAVKTSDRILRTWGANGFGQLGDGSRNDSHVPLVLGNYSSVSVGGGHTVALNTDGTVSDWGYNSNYQLGNNSTSNSSSHILLSGLTGIKAVAAGARHTLALTSGGTVYSWGYNGYGQCGNGGTGDITSPYAITSLPSGITKIAAGGFFSLALASDGTVYAWGDNRAGQIGNADPSGSAVTTPVQVLGPGTTNLSGIVDISAGGSHALALDASGNIWVWGYDYYGQLGDNSTSNSNRTTAFEAWTTGGATSISAGLDHSLAVINGVVYACGHNYNGQLGIGGDLLQDTPHKTFEPITVTSTVFATVTAIGNQSIAIDENGHVWTWGANSYGQLGDGTTTDRGTASMIY